MLIFQVGKMMKKLSVLFLLLLIKHIIVAQVVYDSNPEVKVGAIKNVGITSMEVSGIIVINNPQIIESAGFCWSTLPKPDLTKQSKYCIPGSFGFSCTLSNLEPDSFYFLRAFIITSFDTVFSRTTNFFTHKQDAVPDIDGNYYNTVKTGNQIWLEEDLKTTRLNDGTQIAHDLTDDYWPTRTSPAYSWYGNDSVNFSFPRGKFYNWYTVATNKLCPLGWHVPSTQEWNLLMLFLGGDTVAGGKLKVSGTMFWKYPNYKATNESGFRAFPAGFRKASDGWVHSDMVNHWWCADILSDSTALNWYVYAGTGVLYRTRNSRNMGYSVRCIKD